MGVARCGGECGGLGLQDREGSTDRCHGQRCCRCRHGAAAGRAAAGGSFPPCAMRLTAARVRLAARGTRGEERLNRSCIGQQHRQDHPDSREFQQDQIPRHDSLPSIAARTQLSDRRRTLVAGGNRTRVGAASYATSCGGSGLQDRKYSARRRHRNRCRWGSQGTAAAGTAAIGCLPSRAMRLTAARVGLAAGGREGEQCLHRSCVRQQHRQDHPDSREFQQA